MVQILHLWIALVLAAVIGYAIGTVLVRVFGGRRADGTITVDMTDDNKIFWNIDYDGDPYELQKKKTVTFKIRTKG